MKLSTLFTKTSKTISEEEYSINAQYLLRGGFVRKELAWVYTFLPLGLRVLNKIEAIIRRHMDSVSQEILMTALQPIANREMTHRLDVVDVLMKTTGANEKSKQKSSNEYILWCTHEEIVTPLVQSFAGSYKDLPVSVYQIQSKFRNEARAKSWLLRGREFRMKDAYSFHVNEDDLLAYYEQMKKVYMDIFKNLGIWSDTYITAASGWDFTDWFSHEFQTICEAWEDLVFVDTSTGECYNKEVCPSQVPHITQDTKQKAMKEIYGENIIWVDQLVQFLWVGADHTTKSLYMQADDRVILAVVRGDYDVNELKLKKILWCQTLSLASAETITMLTGAQVGYAWLINVPATVEVYCDDSISDLINFETWSNKTHYHTINVNRDRDVSRPTQFYDFKEAKLWDLNPATGLVWDCQRACEVGNIFPLNTKFSQAFGYHYTDDQGKPQIVYMWCYGIGPSRIMGVLVEKFHDKDGIIRPEAVAPYRYCIIPIWDTAQGLAQDLYSKMMDKGMEVVLDDREVWPGFKLKDADLIGYPWKIIISDKTLAHAPDTAEFVSRKSKESSLTNIRQRLAQQG